MHLRCANVRSAYMYVLGLQIASISASLGSTLAVALADFGRHANDNTVAAPVCLMDSAQQYEL